jgi:hypothetical protein
MSTKLKSAVGALAVAAMVAAGSMVTVPAAHAEPSFQGAQVYQVGGKNWKRSWNNNRNWNRGWNNGRYYNNRGWNGNNWVGPAIGLGAGVIIGSMLAAPRYAPPARAYYGDRNAYCAQKYRSYNPYTGTYTGYDGRQHYCRIP